MSTDVEVIAFSHTEILVDHSQILVHDCAFDFGGKADLDLLYNMESFDHNLVVAPGVLASFTARWYVIVSLDLVARTVPPAEDFSDWANVVEASLDLPSGCVVALTPESSGDHSIRVTRPAGMYHARVYVAGIATVGEQMMEGQDHCHAVRWRAPLAEPILLLGTSGRL
jgi:hypothetical protein